MFYLPGDWLVVLQTFAPLLSAAVWPCAQRLLLGAILAPGKRTVSSVLRVLGAGQAPRFQNYHRVLNRAVWSAWQGARLLLGLPVETFAPTGPLVFGVDETIERRRGRQITARGIYRDAARSSRSVTNKTSGLRWVSVQLLAPVTWAKRIRALPFLTVLAPSRRYYQQRGRRAKTLTDCARQVIAQVRRCGAPSGN
jgi:DDE superfamily endonuclease